MDKKIFAILIALSFFAFIIPNLSPAIKISGDGIGYYSWLHSVFFDQDINFRNQAENCAAWDNNCRTIIERNLVTHSGKTNNPYAFGTAIMWLPAFLIAHFLSLILSQINPDFFQPDGYSYLYFLAIFFATWLFSILALLLNYKILKKVFNDKSSFGFSSLALIAGWLATPWIYYQTLSLSMAHIPSLLVVSYFLYLLIKMWKKEKVSGWVLAIIIFLMISIRWQNLIFTLIYLPLLIEQKREKTPTNNILKTSLLFIVPVAIFWLLQCLIWKYIYGSLFLFTFNWYFAEIKPFGFLYILFSSDRGLFLWSPILILAILGWCWLYKKIPFLGMAVALACVGQWLVNGSLADLGGGWAFGSRRFIETLPFLILSLAALFQKFQKKIKIFYVIVIIAIIWNFILIGNYQIGVIPPGGEFNFFGTDYFSQIGPGITKRLGW